MRHSVLGFNGWRSWPRLRKKGQPKRGVMSWQHGNNPLLLLGQKGQWDEVWSTWASIVRLDAKDWRMYYTGRDRLGHLRIGLAFSEDGITWEKSRGNPILDIGPPNSWDSLYAYGPIVWKARTHWKMIFTGCDALDSSHYQVGLAVSSDGVNWEKFEGNPVFEDHNPANINRFGEHETEAWGLIKDGEENYLFYNPVSRKPRQIWIAHSKDLIAWKPISTSPVLPSAGFPWQLGYMKYCAWPFRHNEFTYLAASVSNVGYTKSRMGLWRIYGPLSSIKNTEFLGYLTDASSVWCEEEVDAPCILEDAGGNKLLCYYSGRSKSGEWTEGLVFFTLEESAF